MTLTHYQINYYFSLEDTFSLQLHELNLPHPQFCQVLSPQTSHKCSYSHPLHVCVSNHTHPLKRLQQSQQPLARTGRKTFLPEMGAVQGERTIFSTCSCIGGQQWSTQSQQGISQAESRDGCAVCTLQVHPPISPYPAFSAEAEPICKGHCMK